jgi:hypothetical protein
MARTFLEAWLLATLGEPPGKSGDGLGRFETFRGSSVGAKVLESLTNGFARLGLSDDASSNQGVKERGQNDTSGDTFSDHSIGGHGDPP